MIMVMLFTGLWGIALIYFGIAILVGDFKRWYLGPRIFPPQAIVYGSVLFGLAAIELCVIVALASYLDPDTTGWVVALTAGLTALSGFVLAIWQPRWIKPHWVRWLEENYWDRIHILIADARRNPRHWEERVATQEGLEEWALQVAGEPRHRHKKD